MTTRERFQAIMGFRPVDRLPRIEWAAWWDKTLERWYQEGLPVELTGDEEIRQWFGLENYIQFWPEPGTDTDFRPLRSPEDYDDIRHRLFPEPSFDYEALKSAAEAQAKGDAVVWLTLEGYFWFPRTLFGIEGHLYAFYDQTELMDRINADLHEWQLNTLESFCRVLTPDFITLAEDMTYNHGPMISRETFEARLGPWYRRLLPELDSRGILPFMDTDGNVHDIVPWLIDAGFRGCLPLERQAGTDLARLRREYPEWLMIGGIDKMKMSGPIDRLERELADCAHLASLGGYIPGVDHQTPPEVSLSAYRRYLDLSDTVFRREYRHCPGNRDS